MLIHSSLVKRGALAVTALSLTLGLTTQAAAVEPDAPAGECVVFSKGGGVEIQLVPNSEKFDFNRAPVVVLKDGGWVKTIAPGVLGSGVTTHKTDLAGSSNDAWSMRIWKDGKAYTNACDVQEVDVNAPVIDDPGTLTWLAYGEYGSPKVEQLNATDPEGHAVTFKLDPGGDPLWPANLDLSSEGSISAGGPMIPGTFEPTVIATDVQGNESRQKLKIVVLDIPNQITCNITQNDDGTITLIADPSFPLAGVSIFRNGKWVQRVTAPELREGVTLDGSKEDDFWHFVQVKEGNRWVSYEFEVDPCENPF